MIIIITPTITAVITVMPAVIQNISTEPTVLMIQGLEIMTAEERQLDRGILYEPADMLAEQPPCIPVDLQ
jgi:hypothetical protein